MNTYCLHTFIPILHSNVNDREQAHGHTIELAAYIQKDNDLFELFTDLEGRINSYLGQYANQFLNALPEFANDASIENIGEVFFTGLTELLGKHGLTLRRLEVGETPLRHYIIGLAD